LHAKAHGYALIKHLQRHTKLYLPVIVQVNIGLLVNIELHMSLSNARVLVLRSASV
jgi:hypothetical protein